MSNILYIYIYIFKTRRPYNVKFKCTILKVHSFNYFVVAFKAKAETQANNKLSRFCMNENETS